LAVVEVFVLKQVSDNFYFQLLPWVRDVLRWVKACDASKSSVDKALQEGDRLGLAPGKYRKITCLSLLFLP